MRRKILIVICVTVCGLAVAAAFAQSDLDPLTGTWTGDWGTTEHDRNQVTLQLDWDGKALSGTVNPDGPHPVPLQKAMFDPETSLVHMEVDARGRGGRPIHYMIDGKVENGAMNGTWNHDRMQGDFTITKK